MNEQEQYQYERCLKQCEEARRQSELESSPCIYWIHKANYYLNFAREIREASESKREKAIPESSQFALAELLGVRECVSVAEATVALVDREWDIDKAKIMLREENNE